MESADVARLTEELLPKLYSFCLKKTSDRVEAEDLTQDIALQVLTALRGGRQPENFSAYVWKIARNRYAAWSDGKRRRRAAADAHLRSCASAIGEAVCAAVAYETEWLDENRPGWRRGLQSEAETRWALLMESADLVRQSVLAQFPPPAPQSVGPWGFTLRPDGGYACAFLVVDREKRASSSTTPAAIFSRCGMPLRRTRSGRDGLCAKPTVTRACAARC